MAKSKSRRARYFDEDSLYVIDSNELYFESIFNRLIEHYKSHSGYSCNFHIISYLPVELFGADFCYMLQTDDVAIYYRCQDDERVLYYWADPQEMKIIMTLITTPVFKYGYETSLN